MCGGKKSSPAPAPVVAQGPHYAPADYSNRQRQAAAIETDTAARTASYGSELGTSAKSGE